MKKNADRFLTALYCDDVRHEMGNKLSFMGCYQGELIVPVVPTLLSKLCVYVSAWTLVEKPFKNLAFRIVQNDDKELARVETPAGALVDGGTPIQADGATRISVSTAVTFSPFFIEKPTSLRLLAMTEEGEIVGPRLLIRVAAPAVSPSPAVEEPMAAPYVTAKRTPAAKKKSASTRKP